ncbi:MAG: hypothetical protein P8Z78_14915 [Gammaproteobacteria bacterium]|jgi:hypothetical protein
MPTPYIENIVIEDDLSEQGQRAIEMMLTLSDSTRRWCYFMTPQAFQACGDWIDGTNTSFHYGSPHMIVVAETLTEEMINKTLRSIEDRGELHNCTLPLDVMDAPDQSPQ